MKPETVPNFIGGEWTCARAESTVEVFNPSLGEVIARTPLSSASDVDAAVEAAQRAFCVWRETPAAVRARSLFAFKTALECHFEELARLVTTEHGKTLDESRGSVRRGIECVEAACGAPSLTMGMALENVAAGIDTTMVRQPIGVCAVIAPFNFPAMVPLWFLPFALACGNTVVLKPSEQVPLCARRLVELLAGCGLPPGAINVVNGAAEAAEALCDHPGVNAVSVVGSTPVARRVYRRATSAGKRVQALGGAKNFTVVMPDADLDRAVPAMIESFFGCAGERCLAGSILLPVAGAAGECRDRFVAAARAVTVGDGARDGVKMGPLISARHRARVIEYIERGIAEGARPLLDGRDLTVADRPNGFFLGPTVFDRISPSMTIATDEIFGPVAAIHPVGDLETALRTIEAHPNANCASIFTADGRTAREFAHRVSPSMVGVNIAVPAPMAFFPFGGAKDSFFGDLKAHGRDAFEFYTQKKVVISRW